MSAALLALACERRVANGLQSGRVGCFESAAARSWRSDECEPLRRIAWAAVVCADPQASTLQSRYSALCVETYASALPLCWPRRTAGGRLRVVALLASAMPDAQALAAIESLADASEHCDCVVAIMGLSQCPGGWPLSHTVRTLRVLPLALVPGIDDARRIAAIDPDLLLDLSGLAAEGGPLLAARPARAVVTLDSASWAHVYPLVDQRREGDKLSLKELLDARVTAASERPVSSLDAAATSALWNSAVAAHQRGEVDVARDGYAQVLAEQPGFAPAEYLAGIAARDGGDPAAARAHFGVAIAAAPGYVEVSIAAARLALDDGDSERAVALCREAIASDAARPDLWRMLGFAHLAARDGRSAAEAFGRVIAISPLDGESHYNHGVALQMLGDFPESARAYQRALFVRPDLTDAHFNLGVVFQEQGANDAAVAAYEAVLAIEPKHVAAHKNLGELLLAAGRIGDWLASFERFEVQCPSALPLAVEALEACQYLGDFARLGRYLDGLRAGVFVAGDEAEMAECLEQILYLLLFFDIEPALVHQLAAHYDAVARRVYGGPAPPREHRRPGRIRVGYLSADLRDHVMGKMMWSALEHSDRQRFELFFYSLSTKEDAWTAKYRGLADHYEVIALLPEPEAAARIATADLDVLVDLCGHTRGSKPGILARKPARVQMTHVASAGSVGLSAVDFKLTDRFADLPESQSSMVETLLPMAGCVYPFRRMTAAAEHPFHRRSAGLGDDAFVIGAFVKAMKLSRRCLDLWREVLARIPRARLAFSPVHWGLREGYLNLTAAAGIAADRIVFLPQGRNEGENQARYTMVDAVLDPMPFGGANGTLEALNMGVPVVTLVGRRHGERTAYSMLVNLGVDATIAHTGREYVEITVRLAEDPGFMSQVRQQIRTQLADSMLTDSLGYMRNLEEAYVEALSIRAPESLVEGATPGSDAPAKSD